MILLIIAAAAIAAGVYYTGKYTGSNATVAAVATEIKKLEAEAVTDAKAVIARIKTATGL